MPLFAFNGTWNKDVPDFHLDTNVVRLRDAYRSSQDIFYRDGVGTRFGFLGRFLGGLFGTGARSRVGDAVKHLKSRQDKTEPIDVVGFSRGAAMAIHFSNRVAKEWRDLGFAKEPEIRFLALFDTVPSFGIPGNDIDIGWMLKLPPIVKTCCHALALDERRRNFPLHRLREKDQEVEPPGLTELWFRGVHSDVGGGNGNVALSSIALNWMLLRAAAAGLKFDEAALAEVRAEMQPGANIHPPLDLIPDPFRHFLPGDAVHESVRWMESKGNLAYNNPLGMPRVDDLGDAVGDFRKAATA